MTLPLVRRNSILALACLAAVVSSALRSDAAESPQPAWRQILQDTSGTGVIPIEVHSWPADGKFAIPASFPEITAVQLLNAHQHQPMSWTFQSGAAQFQLELMSKAPAELPVSIVLETAEKTAQLTGGRITFMASDAQVQGNHATLLSQPGNHCVSFSKDTSDAMSWDFKPTRWGMYDLELTCSAVGVDGPELQLDIPGHAFTLTVPATGGETRYATVPVGRFYLSNAEPFKLRVACKTPNGNGTVNVKAVTLRPAPEGEPIVQEYSGPITLHASNAITHSVTMRYEPAEKKNCLGFWVNPADWAEWEFKVLQPGTYDIELSHGCGKGQGGSDVLLEVGGEKFAFKVRDTGDFHTHATNRIGTVKFGSPGNYSLAVRPQNKKAGAIMDIELVRLVPTGKPQP
jgi:hypothetical protein